VHWGIWHAWALLHVCVCVCIRTHTHTHTHTYIHLHIYMYVCVYIYVYLHIYMYTYIYIFINIQQVELEVGAPSSHDSSSSNGIFFYFFVKCCDIYVYRRLVRRKYCFVLGKNRDWHKQTFFLWGGGTRQMQILFCDSNLTARRWLICRYMSAASKEWQQLVKHVSSK
jgi:hypothetical protein